MKTPRAGFRAFSCKLLSSNGSLHDRFSMLLPMAALALALIAPGTGFAERAEADSSEFVSAALDPCLQPPLDWHEKVFLAQTNDSTLYGPSRVAGTATDANTGEQKVFRPWDFGAVEWRAPDGR